MGILDKLLGGGAAAILSGAKELVDEIFTSQEEKDTAIRLLLEMEQRGLFEQTKINAIEANHRSIFVAGWRPFIGWMSGIILFYAWLIRDLIMWAVAIGGWEVTSPPNLDTTQVVGLVTAMLGIATLRSRDKQLGVTNE